MTSPWALLGLAVSAVLLVCTPWVWRRRGAVSGLRWLSIALLPAGLALTGLLTLVARVSNAVTGFFAGSVFNPATWTGYALIGASVIGLLVARALSSRRRRGGEAAAPAVRASGAARSATPTGVTPAGSGTRRVGPAPSPTAPPSGGDEDFAEIEAILRRRGI